MPSLARRSVRILHRVGPGVGLFVSFLTLLSCLFWMSERASAQGSQEIPFYKHTIDLEQSEATEVAAAGAASIAGAGAAVSLPPQLSHSSKPSKFS